MAFDFAILTGPEHSLELNFSALCSRVVMSIHPDASPVEGKGGDEGIDTFVGDFQGICRVFQHKYFLSTLTRSQRRNIEKSLKTALSGDRVVAEWVLMMPKDLTPSEIRWLDALRGANPQVKIGFWGKTRLQELLAEFPKIAQDYRPKPTIVYMLMDRNIDIRSATESDLARTLEEAVGDQLPQDVLVATARDLKNRTLLKILIWGPGVGGGDIYQKRLELREKLEKLGHSVQFSEEACTPDLLARTGLNLSVAELIQALAYDYIICLMASPGSIGEVYDFARKKRIAMKMMICVDKAHQEGYSAKGVLRVFEGYNGKLDWFEYPSDIRDCHLAGRVIEQIHKVAETKQWEISTGRIS